MLNPEFPDLIPLRIWPARMSRCRTLYVRALYKKEEAAGTGSVQARQAKPPPTVRIIPNGRGRLSQLSRSGHKAGKAFLTSIWNSAANHWPAGTSKPGIEPVE